MTTTPISSPSLVFTFTACRGGQLLITAWLAFLCPESGLNPRFKDNTWLECECWTHSVMKHKSFKSLKKNWIEPFKGQRRSKFVTSLALSQFLKVFLPSFCRYLHRGVFLANTFMTSLYMCNVNMGLIVILCKQNSNYCNSVSLNLDLKTELIVRSSVNRFHPHPKGLRGGFL